MQCCACLQHVVGKNLSQLLNKLGKLNVVHLPEEKTHSLPENSNGLHT